MIGYLKGKILDTEGNNILLLVGDIGYKIRVISNIKYQISNILELFVHTHVREDELSLYGFVNKKSLKIFELLISVSGVGPKMAMNVLSHGSAEEIQKAVATADVAFFTGVSGIGKKNGQRIIVDLKSKLGNLEELDLSDETNDNELVQALVGMGFDRKQVIAVVGKIEISLPEQERLKIAIKKLSS